uniref:eukaryotic translation elongation factor 1 delta b (guanine nucleotide exchange protein) isoform X1 n=2 Tax=Oncorhynchus gorbuscha TaxID=8017 RepID=UPI001EAE86C0|nr:eukaryotic translation elongation factor 1 delta b (guanine nucleotide exchange protein) isoform X1 [Oncorhynchus gorbuscha]
MMPQRNPLCSAMDQSDPDLPSRRCQVDCTTEVAVEGGQRNRGGAASSSPESSSVNGDGNGKRSGKRRRRRKRSAQPDNRPAPVAMMTPPPGQEKGEEPQLCQKGSSHISPDPAPDSPGAVLLGLRSECGSVWFDRSVYEQAESLYQCWLAHSANGSMTRPIGSPPTLTTDNHPASPQPSLSPSPQALNHPSNHPPIVAKEHCIVAEPLQPAAPEFLALPANSPSTPATPDEGYLSLAQTPQAASTSPLTPAPGQPVNGLPCLPMELLRDVWLEKPLYDRAEAAFYQSLYGNNRSPTGNNLGGGVSTSRTNPNAPSTSRGSGDHPQRLVEEEEEEGEEEEVVEEEAVVSQGKLEVFHALRTIQEEEEPADVAQEEGGAMSMGGVCYFLHPDSERVWLEQRRYEAAESRFYSYRQIVPAESTVADREEGARGQEDAVVSATLLPQPSSVACTGPLRDNTMSSAVDYFVQEKIWFDKPRYDDAERHFYERINSTSHPAQELGANTILQDIARARENIQKSLAGLKNSLLPSRGFDQPQNPHPSAANGAGDQGELITRIKSLELENNSLNQVVDDLRLALSKLECRVAVLEKSPSPAAAPVSAAPCTNGTSVQQQKTSPPVEDEDDDDDMDLFGSDEEEDAEAERLKEQRLKEYAEKKAKKPTLIAKSSILLDVKPWDDETDMAKLEECVRSVVADGLLWGQSKLVPVGYGIRKLQIQCVVEDDKVGTDLLEEEITKFEDFVQSVDVAAFNKI